MDNRSLGIKAIGYWYLAAQMQMEGVTLEQAIAYLDSQHPSLIAQLGGAVKDSNLSDSQVRDAMRRLGTAGMGQYPDASSFFDALIGGVNSKLWSFETVKEVASETTSQVETIAVAGVGLYALWIVGGLVALMLLERREAHG